MRSLDSFRHDLRKGVVRVQQREERMKGGGEGKVCFWEGKRRDVARELFLSDPCHWVTDRVPGRRRGISPDVRPVVSWNDEKRGTAVFPVLSRQP